MTGVVGNRQAQQVLRFAVTLVAVLLVAAVAGFGSRYLSHLGQLRDKTDGICGRFTATPMQVGGESPFGAVTGCTVLDRSVPLWGAVDGSISLLLATGSGTAAIRIDYSRLSAGRQYRAEAFELPAGAAPGLSGAQERQLRQDIAARGGVRTTAWVMHYGDG
ncbi:hypothetical protein ACFPIJ_17095 [Dactylosporangium cerinum]|uniref:Uncharacterized protein n=1 Tax=Dactylosporangium cerinum TaxID=1434730 RepID=A0ABV9VVX7_9ACTN